MAVALLSSLVKASQWFQLETSNAGNFSVFCDAADDGRAETSLPIGARFLLEVDSIGSVPSIVVDVLGQRCLSLDLPPGTVVYLGGFPFIVGDKVPPRIVQSKVSFAWWRSDLGVDQTANRVASWTDQVGGFAPSALGASQPNYLASDPVFGGRPSIGGDGVVMHLNGVGGLATLLSGDDKPFCVFTIVRPQSVFADGVFWALCNTSGASLVHINFVNSAAKLGAVRASASQISAASIVANTNYLVRTFFDGQNITVIVNGVTFINNLPLNVGPINFSRFLMFAQQQTGAPLSFLLGKICEQYWCDFQPTAQEITDLVQYFQVLYPGVS